MGAPKSVYRGNDESKQGGNQPGQEKTAERSRTSVFWDPVIGSTFTFYTYIYWFDWLSVCLSVYDDSSPSPIARSAALNLASLNHRASSLASW